MPRWERFRKMGRLDAYNLAALTTFKQLGFTVAIDDFGTGYSSLAYLKRLPVNKLKIDQSFISGMLQDSDSRALTKAIISLGKCLRLLVLAEGVQTREEADFLAMEGCDQMQGYYFGEPLSSTELERQLLNPDFPLAPISNVRH
jgi:EAL domain-containing protein (putative c-di-GMP-specific phosphodiesterase class I)